MERHVSEVAPLVLKPSRLRTGIRVALVERTMRSLPKSDRVLDLCCGHGFYLRTNPLAKGIDGDPNCVRSLVAEGHDVVVGDVTKRLPFDDGEFSIVLAHDVLEHFILPELEEIFDEVYRILDDDGEFVVWVPNRKGYDSGVNPEVGHRLFVTATEIAQLAAGRFRVEANYSEPLPRTIGEYFIHNKEVFRLRKATERRK